LTHFSKYTPQASR